LAWFRKKKKEKQQPELNFSFEIPNPGESTRAEHDVVTDLDTLPEVPVPPKKKLSKKEKKQKEAEELLQQQPPIKECKDKRKLKGLWRYYFKSRKVCKAVTFNKNNTTTYHYVVPSRNQFSIGNDKYIWDSASSQWDTVNKVFTAFYYEGVPLPVILFSDGKKLSFDTIDSDTYKQVSKMEYIKTLSQTGAISKILKSNFLVSLVSMFGIIILVILMIVHMKGGM